MRIFRHFFVLTIKNFPTILLKVRQRTIKKALNLPAQTRRKRDKRLGISAGGGDKMCTETEKSGELCCKSAGRLVNILSNQLKRRFLVPDDGNELTMLQRHMLHFIIVGSMHQDIFQKDVEAEFQIRKSTATGSLQLLEKKGFIRRESVERDGRLKRVLPTDKALAMRDRVMQSLRSAEKQMLQGIDKEDLDVCIQVLARMSRNLSCKEQDCKEQECRLT